MTQMGSFVTELCISN